MSHHGTVYRVTCEVRLLGKVLECDTSHPVEEGELVLLTETGRVLQRITVPFGVEPNQKNTVMCLNMGPKNLDQLLHEGALEKLGYGHWSVEDLKIVVTSPV